MKSATSAIAAILAGESARVAADVRLHRDSSLTSRDPSGAPATIASSVPSTDARLERKVTDG
jgi:hypothetical protein